MVGDEEVCRKSRGAFGPLEVALHGGSVLAAHPLEAVEVHGERSGSAQEFEGKPRGRRGGPEGKVDVGPLMGRIANAQQVVNELAGGTHPRFWITVDSSAHARVRPFGDGVGRRGGYVNAPPEC